MLYNDTTDPDARKKAKAFKKIAEGKYDEAVGQLSLDESLMIKVMRNLSKSHYHELRQTLKGHVELVPYQ